MADRKEKERGLKFNALSAGSEFSFEFYCQVCKDDGRNEEAEGFCVNCSEYLCGVCYRSHQRTRQTRIHEILGKEEMPKVTPLPPDPVNRDISTICKHHADRTVEFYCKSHNVIECSTCFATSHRSCPYVESILNKSESIYDSREYTDFIQTLKSINQAARAMISKARGNIYKIKSCFTEVLKSVKMLKKEVSEILDKLEKDVIADADMLVTDEEIKMDSISNKCRTFRENIEIMLLDFQSLQSSQRVCQTYISMKKSGEQIKTMQDNIRNMEASLALKTFGFEPNRAMPYFMKNPYALGKISTNVQKISVRVQTKAKTQTPTKPTRVADINVRSKSDTDDSWVTGSAVIFSTRLIIVDNKNCKVKLLDTQPNKLTGELKTPKWPWDVTAIGATDAAVTLQNNKKILLLNVSRTLTMHREIAVSGFCQGVDYSMGKLVVTYYNPGKVEIMDLYGNVMKSIETDSFGNRLFQYPNYVRVSKDGETIYISDYDRNSVSSLRLDGAVKSVYSDSELKGPRKVCFDHHDNVYICGRDSRDVHMLTVDLFKIQIILTRTDGLDSEVLSASYCQNANRLYMAMRNNNNIHTFQLA